MLAGILPIPAFIDWSLNQLEIDSGTNKSRYIKGGLLGISYASLLYNIFNQLTYFPTYLIIFFYLSLAVTLPKLLF